MTDLHPLIEDLQDLINEVKFGRHRVVRIRTVKGRQVRQIRWKCGPGWKSTPEGCKKIAGKERVTRMLAQKKRLRTVRAKGSGYKIRAQRKRTKALRRGSAMGLYKHKVSTGFKPKPLKLHKYKAPKAPKPKAYKPPKPPKAPKPKKFKPPKPPKRHH